MSFARETRIAAAWNAWHMMDEFWKAQVDHKYQCNDFKATRLMEHELFVLDARQNKLARRLLAMTRRPWDSEPQQQQISTKELRPNLESVPIAMEVRMRRLHWAKRMAEQSQKDDPSHQQVLAAIFDQKRLDKYLA